MRVDQVEIYSDVTNLVVLRHPGRHFPGVLMQGDSLHTLCILADNACRLAKEQGCIDAFAEMNELRNALRARLNHYKQVLAEHGIPLPFNDTNSA